MAELTRKFLKFRFVACSTCGRLVLNFEPFHRNSFSYQLTSAAIYPFITLATVSNREKYLKSLRIKVRKVHAFCIKQIWSLFQLT